MNHGLKFGQWMLVAVLATVLVACGALVKLTPENFAKIDTEMNEQQVTELIGKPTEVKTGTFLGITGTTYVYKVGAREARVVFVNGKVFGKEGQL